MSDPFPEAETEPFAGRTWTRLEAEPNGLTDLSRVNPIRDDRNTVLARATIRADRARTVRMDFGFSDRAVVYLNGRPLYRGDDTYRSRDYRFLGTIGWWDTLYLPLEPATTSSRSPSRRPSAAGASRRGSRTPPGCHAE